MLFNSNQRLMVLDFVSNTGSVFANSFVNSVLYQLTLIFVSDSGNFISGMKKFSRKQIENLVISTDPVSHRLLPQMNMVSSTKKSNEIQRLMMMIYARDFQTLNFLNTVIEINAASVSSINFILEKLLTRFFFQECDVDDLNKSFIVFLVYLLDLTKKHVDDLCHINESEEDYEIANEFMSFLLKIYSIVQQ